MACGARRNFSDDFIYSSHPTNGEIRSPVDGIYSAKLGTDHRCLFLLFKFLFLRILPPFTYLKSVGYRVFFFFHLFHLFLIFLVWSSATHVFSDCFDWIAQQKHACREVAFGMHEANYEKRLRHNVEKNACSKGVYGRLSGVNIMWLMHEIWKTPVTFLRDLLYWKPMTNLFMKKVCNYTNSSITIK